MDNFLTDDDFMKNNENKQNEIISQDENINSSLKMIQKICELSNKSIPLVFGITEWKGVKKYDVRCWKENFSKPLGGIRLSKEELYNLYLYCRDNNLTYSTYAQKYEQGNITAEIKNMVILSERRTKNSVWRTELNNVDWGRGYKYDIRAWNTEYSKCSKGVRLSKTEIENLCDKLKNIFD